MFVTKLIVLQILNILMCKGIKTQALVTKANYKTLKNGAVYLNSQQPLWILQDHKDKDITQQKLLLKVPEKLGHFKTLKHHKTKTSNLLRGNRLKSFKAPRNFKAKAQKLLGKHGVQLPHNYIPVKNVRKSNFLTATKRYKNSKFLKNMPVFDAIPGQESFTKSTPIFIYNGNKGRMLLNTMLSKDKYPMQEPIPGQVLHPPQPLVFKPKSLIENLQRKLNVTMIPFYAYDAIDPTIDTSTALYTPAKKHKRAKQYAAFFSPDEVLAQPFTDFTHYPNHIEQPTTFTPLTLSKPFANHRFENLATSTAAPSVPHKKLEVIYHGGEDKFQITLEDDKMALERPLNAPATNRFTTIQPPLTYESYTFDDNYYAFPVYTMSKLLENNKNNNNNQMENNVSTERESIDQLIDTALKDENDQFINNNSNEDTWFIMNSRYKGPLKTTSTNDVHSSKYVQTSPTKLLDNATKTFLQPQKRSL